MILLLINHLQYIYILYIYIVFLFWDTLKAIHYYPIEIFRENILLMLNKPLIKIFSCLFFHNISYIYWQNESQEMVFHGLRRGFHSNFESITFKVILGKPFTAA